MKKIALGIFALIAFLVFCQSSDRPAGTEVDKLFEQTDDIVAEPDGSSLLSQFDEDRGLKVYGTLAASAGLSAGWTDWPNIQNLSENWSFLPGLLFSTGIAFDARPEGFLRIHGALSSSFKESFHILVDELFFDYALSDIVFFRGGKQTLGWGTGLLFETGDFVAGIEDKISVKAYLPFGANGFTFAGMLKLPDEVVSLSYKDLSLAGKLELAFLGLEWNLSALYADPLSFEYHTALKGSLFGADLFCAATGTLKSSVPGLKSAACGFFWENADPRIQFSVEYFLNGEVANFADHRVSLAALYRIPAPMNPKLGLQLSHAFIDSSGSFLPAFSFNPFPHFTLSLVMPIAYGASDALYVENPPPGWDKDLPWSRRCALAIKLDFSFDF